MIVFEIPQPTNLRETSLHLSVLTKIQISFILIKQPICKLIIDQIIYFCTCFLCYYWIKTTTKGESHTFMKKTNAVRILDQHNISCELVEYDVDELDLSAASVAKKLGQNVEQVFKTLVLRGNKFGIFVVVIPGNTEVDLKKAAKASGNKSAEMIAMKELLPLTGYIRGGCTAIGMKKAYPNYIDESCLIFDFIYISAGARGMQIKIAPEDLISLTNMTVGDFTCSTL